MRLSLLALLVVELAACSGGSGGAPSGGNGGGAGVQLSQGGSGGGGQAATGGSAAVGDGGSCEAPLVDLYTRPGCGLEAPGPVHGVAMATENCPNLNYACSCEGKIVEGCSGIFRETFDHVIGPGPLVGTLAAVGPVGSPCDPTHEGALCADGRSPSFYPHTQPGCGASAPAGQCFPAFEHACLMWACSCTGKLLSGCDGFSEPFDHMIPGPPFTDCSPNAAADGGADAVEWQPPTGG